MKVIIEEMKRPLLYCKDCRYYMDANGKDLPEVYKKAIEKDEAKMFTGYCFYHGTFVFFEWCCGEGEPK